MREATNGEYPKFAIWENVRGAFSSSKGEDFRCVLERFARIVEPDVSIPRPSGKNGKWAKSGAISGNGWSIAWRLFDAKYWGVAQRRQRIALVMDFGGQRASEILFERTSMSGDSCESIPAWKTFARTPEASVAGYLCPFCVTKLEKLEPKCPECHHKMDWGVWIDKNAKHNYACTESGVL